MRSSVGLGEHAPPVDAVGADVRVDLGGRRLPAGRDPGVVAKPRQSRTSVERDPAHQLGRREVLRLAAHLPDPPIRLSPVGERVLNRAAEDWP